MTANTYAAGSPGAPGPTPGQVPGGRISPLAGVPAKANFAGAVRSEWTKIRTVRSTFWTLIATMVITIGLSTLISWGVSSHDSVEALRHEDLVSSSLAGLFLGQLVIVVFGSLALTAEYTTGMIRTSFTSQPRRGTLFAAKALVTGLVALAVGLVSSFASFFIGSAFFSGKGIDIALSDPGVARAVVGGGLYLAVSALLAFGLGAILRHTAGAITGSVGLLFVVTILANFLPGSWRDDVVKFLPADAGQQIMGTQPQEHMLSPWGGFAVFALYAAIALGFGMLLMRKRDA
jgi:ABC-2 type transport system permease protein